MNKSRLIMQQHAPFAAMMSRALEFCESMLSHSSVLYPFALVTDVNDTHCVFVPSIEQQATPHMIEELLGQLEHAVVEGVHCANLLVYPATVTHPNSTESDALVFTINDTQGHNTVTIYPYKHVLSGIRISQPYTCDFPD